MSLRLLFRQIVLGLQNQKLKKLNQQSIRNYLKFINFTNTSKYILAPGSFSFIIAFTQSKNTTDEIEEGELKYFIKKKNLKMTDQDHNQDLKNVLDHADQLFDENHFQEAFETLNKYDNQSLSEISWRKARTLFQLSKTMKDKNERNKLINQSNDLIQSAYEKDQNNFAIHKWLAIIIDAHAELNGIKTRIEKLDTIKHHMEKAIELNPEDPTSWYILGAFEYGLADLPWIQRKIVSTVFATPPTGSYENALKYFEKAEELKEGFYSTNWLMMGKCYYALKDYQNAKIYLEKAANCRVLNEDDKNCKDEAQKLLKKL